MNSPRNNSAIESLISLGSNIGDRAAYLEAARSRLEGLPATKITAISRILETDPVEYLDQNKFLNQIVKISTQLDPWELLRSCHEIESQLGRRREVDKGPRTIDLDILTYGNQEINSETLQIPHPALGVREFLDELLDDLGLQTPD